MSLLVTPLLIASISALLAVFIVVIDGFVNNYGEVDLNINEGQKKLTIKGGAPLLTTLSEQKIFIPSACGGRGSCGACKIKVASDIGPIYPTEAPFLTQEEQKENTRLSCQIKVKTNLDLEIPEELFNVKQYESVVKSIKDVTHDIKEINFQLITPDNIKYKAGQYMQLEIPAYDKIKDPTQRAYSMASVPSDEKAVELLIRLVPGGTVTTYVFNHLSEGDNVRLIGPFGDFCLRQTNADMICVAGGSGMAPIKSIVNDMLEKKITDRQVWYFFGARSKIDLFYLEEFKKIEQIWPDFHFIPALSEPLPGDDWNGETGLITDVLDRYLKQKINQENEKEGYLCGSPGMIDACLKVMTTNKMKEEKIFFDKFA